MLSVLIPVYNFDIRQLVAELDAQCAKEGISYEILCYDDGSTDEYNTINSEVLNNHGVIFKKLETNIGRSKIRNLLAADAKYPYLLFMDCDSEVTTNHYIKDYIKVLDEETVIYGGRVYGNQPEDSEKYLRWKYGIERETIDSDARTENPYRSFMTNNFIIPKKVFRKVKLNEKLKGYGHEDTLMAIELRKLKAPLIHIQNPLCHIGLETADEFLAKTRQGVKNLAYMVQNDLIDDNNKLYNYYLRFKRLKLLPIIKRYLNIKRDSILKNLKSSSADLKNFDLYKLDLLIKELN